jgi:hypothetical protein
MKNLPTIWTANAVADRRPDAAAASPGDRVSGVTGPASRGLELAVGVPLRFVSLVTVLDAMQNIRRRPAASLRVPIQGAPHARPAGGHHHGLDLPPARSVVNGHHVHEPGTRALLARLERVDHLQRAGRGHRPARPC